MPNFRDDVQRSFPYLFEQWGFKFSEVMNDYGGNIVVAETDKVKIRFIRDRADFFMDIGRNETPMKWIGFYKIIDNLNAKGIVDIDYKYVNRIVAVSRLLDHFFLEIQKSLSSNCSRDD